MLNERIYAYRRRFTWPLELLSALLVAGATLKFGRVAFKLLMREHLVKALIQDQALWVRQAVDWLQRDAGPARTPIDLLSPLAFLLLALLITQFLRNMLPTIRTSERGMLVRWGGDWVPVAWNGMQAMRLTEAGNRFAVLIETNDEQLTGWHRWYGLLYRGRWHRGFIVTSAMRGGEDFLREITGELTRMAKLGMQAPITMDDGHPSLLFRLLMGGLRRKPAAVKGVVARQPKTTSAPASVLPAAPDQIASIYRPWVTQALWAVAGLLGGLALWQYVRAVLNFGYYQFPRLRSVAFVERFAQVGVESPWGLLLSAHLGLLLVGGVIALLFHLFPTVAADGNGLSISVLGKTRQVPWSAVRAVKATPMRGDHHVVLIEAQRKALPWWWSIGSWVYEGGLGRGALLWPMARNFEPLMQRVALEVTRQPVGEDDGPRLRDDAPGWLIMLMTQPAEAIDQLVRLEQEREEGSGLNWPRLLRLLPTMLWVAVMPALVFLSYRMLFRGALGPQAVPLLMFALIWGVAEWPLISLIAKALDDMLGSGTKEYSGLFIYPIIQLPRLLPLAGALVLILLGFPLLAWVVWVVGIIWSAILTAGLWEALYGWRGSVLIAGAAPGVLAQLLTLLVVAGLS